MWHCCRMDVCVVSSVITRTKCVQNELQGIAVYLELVYFYLVSHFNLLVVISRLSREHTCNSERNLIMEH